MEKEDKGLYQKYKVERNDGKEITTGSFVLELKDQHARTAILAYASALEKSGEKKDLVYDLRTWVAKHQAPEEHSNTYTFKRLVVVPACTDTISNENVYIQPFCSNEVVGGYDEEESIVLDAIITVDTKPFTKHKLNLISKEQVEKNKVIESIAKFVINEYMDTPEYISVEQMWNDKKDFYVSMFNQDPDILWGEIESQFEKN